MGNLSNILPFGVGKAYKEKHDWLVEHGYISYIDGVQFLSSRAVSILSGVPASKIKGAVKDGFVSNEVAYEMKRKARSVKERYGTSDYVEILYAATHGGEFDE